jgi:PKD repeat protein
VYAIASGNGDIFGNPLDACGFSPADVSTAITVNASTINDSRASFSNYGPCTDIYAPGVNITAAWIGSNSATNTISGTSMATPHVAGVVGLYLAANPTATPAQVTAALVANASANKITNPLPNTPNKLLYMGFIGGGPPNQPPAAHFTVNCPTLQCTFDGSTSTDDAGVVSYAWTWGNGSGETHTYPVTKKTYQTAGTYNVTLKVTDGGGLTNSITVPVQVPTVTNQPPTATITQPTNNASFVQGTSVSFAGTGNDPETGALTGGALVWTSDRDGQIGTGTGFSSTTLSVGTHVITLTATDPQLKTGTATRTITITPSGGGNQPPVAAFTVICNTLPHQCSFDASTSTDDHGIVSYAWNWGNGRSETKTGPTTKNTWAATGTYNVTLTVTDAGGLSSSVVVAVAVP